MELLIYHPEISARAKPGAKAHAQDLDAPHTFCGRPLRGRRRRRPAGRGEPVSGDRSEGDPIAHQLTVYRARPSVYRLECSCGWRGYNRRGKDFWRRVQALGPALAHLASVGATPRLPEYVDLDPTNSWRRRRARS